MTRVRKVAAVSLMTPMAAAVIAFGLDRPASAVEMCPPLASATINAPTGTVTVGKTVFVSAQIRGLMLLRAHLQVSGPGLDQQVGASAITGWISGNVTVPAPGTYTLAIIGNATGCTYNSAEFTAKQHVVASPTRSSAPSSTPRPSKTGQHSPGNGANPLPGETRGRSAAGSDRRLPLNDPSPFSLPPVTPDGSAQGFAYPTPEPQVASPPVQPVARSVAETTPIKWGQSLAIALVLLVVSAHLGMWSRRQRLAAEGAHSMSDRGGRGRAARKALRESGTAMAATAEPITAEPITAEPITAEPITAEPITAEDFADAGGRTSAGLMRETIGSASDDDAPADIAPDDDASSPGGHRTAPADRRSGRSVGRGYQGRRRRD